MRIVERASFSPGACAVSGEAEGPFLDLEVCMPAHDGRIYLRPGVVQMAAKECGLFDSRDEKIKHLEDQINSLENEVTSLNSELDAYTLIEKSPRRHKPRHESTID